MTIGKTERNDRKNNRAECVGDKSDLEGQRGRARKRRKEKRREMSRVLGYANGRIRDTQVEHTRKKSGQHKTETKR